MPVTKFESDVIRYEAQITWKVIRIRELIKRKETLNSPYFSCKEDPNSAIWSLHLDFGGNCREDFLSFTCTNHNPSCEIFVESLEFELSSKSGKRVDGGCFFTDLTFIGANSDRSSKRWVTGAKLCTLASLTEKGQLLHDGNLHLTCKIKYCGSVITRQIAGPVCSPNFLAHVDVKVDSTTLHDFIRNSLIDDFVTLAISSDSADISIVVGEQKIPAHKCILAARSPVLKTMLSNVVEVSYNDRVDEVPRFELKIEQKNFAAVDAFIKFLYSGKIPNGLDSAKTRESLAKELLEMSTFYQVKSLKIACSVALTNALCLTNACDLMIIAHLHDCPVLKSQSMALIIKHANKVMTQDQWATLSNKYPELLSEVCQALARKKK